MSPRPSHRRTVPPAATSREVAGPTGKRSRRQPLLLAVSTILVGTLVLIFLTPSAPMSQAALALARGDSAAALRLAVNELAESPQSALAATIAGEACVQTRDWREAASYFNRVPQDPPQNYAIARRGLGRAALEEGRAAQAEVELKHAVQFDPRDGVAADSLIYLYALQGRAAETRQLAFAQLQAGVLSPNYLILLGRDRSRMEGAAAFAAKCKRAVPDDPLPYLAEAQLAWHDGDQPAALQHLDRVVTKYPQLIEAQALRCRLLAAIGDGAAFEAAVAEIPADVASHANYWFGHGLWAEQQGELPVAARAFWEAVRRDPFLTDANYQLSQQFTALNRSDAAQAFAERAQALTNLSLDLQTLAAEFSLPLAERAVRQLEAMGRYWEAVGWSELAIQQSKQRPDWALKVIQRHSRALVTITTPLAPSHDLTRRFDLSSDPLPQPLRGRTSSPPPMASDTAAGPPTDAAPPLADAARTPRISSRPKLPTVNSAGTGARITFRDDAADQQLSFRYHAAALGGDWESLYEMDGGGIAVLDFDGDHWPDLYFTEGGVLPPNPFTPLRVDQLWRNPGQGAPFENVTAGAGLTDIGYGQGVTVGDFDNDGFPDLYVGNIGRNQLLHNNGDGTFTDVTDAAGVAAGGWTSSAVFADLNGDSLPDLYVVTYLAGDDLNRPCPKRGAHRCNPLDFAAAPDRFYLNRGDGQFDDLSETHGLQAADGRGLGVIAADFDGSRRLSLFVANDMSANFFFANLTISPQDWRMEESALLRGLAFDHLGRAKACMGVTAGDYNGDGRLDLFVTNFYRQSNDLYTQLPDGTFRDLTQRARLFEPSYLKLGWGTQFLDMDRDGHPDLLVANGHVFEPLDGKTPYQMPAQAFHNRGNGTFTELAAAELGPYFQRPRLGRPLVRLDWNRDGREDVCVGHLDEPIALLTNTTPDTHHFLGLRLVATTTARDALGTIVKIMLGDRTLTQQLTGGDGFQCANERRLHFGAGTATVADKLVVSWPSGMTQEFTAVPLDRDYILVEQRDLEPLSGSSIITERPAPVSPPEDH